MTMEGRTASPRIQRITGRDLPLPTVDIPWLALPVPIPHSAASLSACVLLAEFYFFSTYRALAWLSVRKVSMS